MEEEVARNRVHKKINGLRLAYRRELKTITDSMKSGAKQSAYTGACKTCYTITVNTTVITKMNFPVQNI
jgi:hypothetical protein